MKKIITILALSLWFSSISFTQNSYRDSLLNLIEQSKEDSTLAQLYTDIGRYYLSTNLDSSIFFTESAIEYANKSNVPEKIVIAINLKGNYYERKAEYDQAMVYYNEALELCKELGYDKGFAVVLNNMAIVHSDKGEYPKAIKMYQQALEYERKINNAQGIAEAYNNIGVVYYYQQDMDRVFEYFEKSVAISEKINDEAGQKRSYNNLGALYNHFEEYDKALDNYFKSLELAKKQNDQSQISQNLNNIAVAKYLQKKFDEAASYHEQSIAIKKSMEDYAGMANGYMNFGSLHRDQKNYKKAEEYYLKSIDIAKKYKSRYVLQEAYALLAKSFSNQGKHQEAYEYSLLHSAAKDSIISVEKTKAIEEMEAKYENEVKSRELAEKDKAIALSELKASNQQKWIYGLLGLAATLFFLGLFIVQRNQRKAQAEKDAAVIEERDKGIKAVIDAQESERSRISKDLHDGIGQQLSGLKMAWQKLSEDVAKSNPTAQERLSDLTQILNESTVEVRNISHQMMPRTLQELGLATALEDMLIKSLKFTDIEHSFETFRADRRFDKEVELGLYRVGQELVNNIIKHSGANMVNMQLFSNKKHLILVVEDNGRGISKKKTDGHGMLNMKTRINAVNGDINLEPSPESGTLATIRVPI